MLTLLGWIFFFLPGTGQDLQSLSALIVKNGLSLTGQPYVAGTLETVGPERLKYFSDKFDCVTYVEYTLAMALFEQQYSDPCSLSFEQILTKMRYRNGIIAGYGSRNHYFTSWIDQQNRMGILDDITRELGGIPVSKKINFMSQNSVKYPKLKDKGALKAIKKSERLINGLERYFIPKQQLKQALNKIQSGDIIAITTTISGLDIVHTGIAVVECDSVFLLHASEKEKKVVRSALPLDEYLAGNKSQSGVVILRPR